MVQLRHGPENVQRVPAKVSGDAGLEFFTTNGCLIQCYAPEETSDTAKSSSAMKQKATSDLPKLIKNSKIISGILQDLKARRWILMCPFLDDKDVIRHVRVKGQDILAANLSFVTRDFEALVHSQEDFSVEIATLKRQSLGPKLAYEPPSDAAIAEKSGEFADKLEAKLRHAYPDMQENTLREKKELYVRGFLRRENAISALRRSYPALWEQLINSIGAEETRLSLFGSTETQPAFRLRESLGRIEQSLGRDLPSMPSSLITDLSVGTLSDWLIRCPLDFD
ncbi:hypothetical protein [Devosia limi]|uniref:hypothetical protein n=1 Tax=Devosia limi TaxID=288995 RepID=UPI001160AF51|nr:hypothetical protein [Devosia limi]